MIITICIACLTGCGKHQVLTSSNNVLCTNGSDIINNKGETIVLRGVNLGGWLLQEYWMCPVKGNPEIEKWTHRETLEVLTERFGKEKANQLMAEYEKNWITSYDIRKIAKTNMNVIRVPFGYWNFMNNADGEWIEDNPDENPGFKTLDWIINEASKNDIYVILDMHGCPGGQTTDHVCGNARQQELLGSEKYQATMEKLWVAIAQRYANNATVAAYDIMNEPQDGDYTVETDPRNQIYDRMYKAIREVDSNHMIMMEGIWSIGKLPKPSDMGWENVVYEVHSYGDKDVVGYVNNLKTYAEKNSVPVYIGEFSDLEILRVCTEENISCTSWTYKGTKEVGDTWYMYYKYCPEADVLNDSYEDIMKKWGKGIRTESFKTNEKVTLAWK